MGLQNRDKGVSEQRDILYATFDSALGATPIGGATAIIAMVAFDCAVLQISIAAQGVTTGSALDFDVLRYTAGGLTSFSLGQSNMLVQAYGVSGYQSWGPSNGMLPQGSTLLSLQTGDILYVSPASGSNILSLAIDIAVIKTQDIVSQLGLPSV